VIFGEGKCSTISPMDFFSATKSLACRFFLVSNLLLGGVSAFASSSPAIGNDGISPAPLAGDNETPNSAELMRIAYLALVRDSIVRVDPKLIGRAAVAALNRRTPGRVISLPENFGEDFKSDASWLGAQMTDLASPWTVIEAMGRAPAMAHMALTSLQRKQGIRALIEGNPLCSPGFNLVPQADGRLVVFDVIKGASADVSGLRTGDILTSVSGERAIWADPFRINTLTAGTDVKIGIERSGRAETMELHLIKSDISPVESRLLDRRIGYIFIRWFARSQNPEHDTAGLVRRALATLLSQGAQGLVIDLRSAMGGSGEVSIASALCDGNLIYTFQSSNFAPGREVKREGERIWPDRPIVALVNENTVSAGEFLVLALRELGGAKVVGRMSRGGLTRFSAVSLAEGYVMTIPTEGVLGPVSGLEQPGRAIKPDFDISNPTSEELRRGRDRQLDLAGSILTDKPFRPSSLH
jgi:C-terminal processing protease CtpA/Prc